MHVVSRLNSGELRTNVFLSRSAACLCHGWKYIATRVHTLQTEKQFVAGTVTDMQDQLSHAVSLSGCNPWMQAVSGSMGTC